MGLLSRQAYTLTIKTLRITFLRHWISTPLRAFVLPVLIVLFLSFTKQFTSKDSKYGLGSSNPIRPLSDVLGLATDGRDRIVFASRFSGGAIDSVIEEVSAHLRASGVQVQKLEHEEQLRSACFSTIQGTSKCLAAAVFHSSSSEGNGTWNYTLRADGALGQTVFIDTTTNDAQVYTLPLQRAIDFAIANYTFGANSTALAMKVYDYPFTSKTEEQRQADNRSRFMNMVKDVLAAPFYLALACVIYQMTGFIATEQEIGMTRLLDTMMPNRKRWQPPVIRMLSNHLAFDLLYIPGWIASGAILGAMCFPATTIIIPIFFNILAGLSTTSFAALAAAFFRKAQLSGIVAIVAALVLAIVAQLVKSGTAVVVILSLIFPPMNYVYFLVTMTRWESSNRATNVTENAPDSSFAIPGILFWVFACFHTILYLVLAVVVDCWLHETASSSRRTVVSPSPIAVNLNGFTKEYPPSWMDRMLQHWNKRQLENVIAVDNVSLQSHRGEILVLLGANGSGKSTTLDAIAGQHSPTHGFITINYNNPREGFGYCPQRNILWDELTVREHIYIFDRIKSVGQTAPRTEIDSLIESCDLSTKKNGLSKSLSGGQKRKLQLGMMFAGGSAVCCVDEVSSGVDPLSRRKLWDILLAERGRRSIILTTHFLDEADLLADRIAILSRGRLKALGSSVELKHQLGSGYRVYLRYAPGAPERPPIYRDVLHSEERHGITYFPGSSADAYQFLRRLDRDGVQDYEVNGPRLEDVFFEVEKDAHTEHHVRASYNSARPLMKMDQERDDSMFQLGKGRPIGIGKQVIALLSKRFTILWRNPTPYLALLAIVLVAAGCSTLFLKDARVGQCNPEDAISSGGQQAAVEYKLVAGPQIQLSAAAVEQIAAAPPGSVSVVDTLDDFNSAVSSRFSELTPGGFFLGSEPTIAWRADGAGPIMAHITQNLLNSLLLNVTISSNYEALDVPFVADLSHYLLFIIYFGLSMAVYPAFMALYPTMERLRGIRSMHYSNGVRPLPLWLAYLAFDFSFVVVMALVSVIILAATADLWYAISYLFLIFLLYGIAAGLFSYVVSLFASSQLAALAVTAASQAVFFLVYFVIFMVVYTYTEASKQASTMNIAFFTLGLVSPVVSLSRCLYVALNVFGVSCRDKALASYPGAIDLYGGPILYLVVQSLLLFAVLVWKDSGVSLRLPHRPGRGKGNTDDMELQPSMRGTSPVRLESGLQVVNLRKRFKRHTAVDDVSFHVPQGDCFALVGPNGAGKSTSIAMIRGDTQPSSTASEILIDGLSALRERRKTRPKLGVCPQIDPLDHLTVAEHLHFYAKIRGLQEPSAAVHAIISAVGLDLFTHRIAANLSGGNKRKLSLAIALVGNPSVLLLDEPSSGMDAVSKRVMWRTLAALTPGRSILLTTHSMEEADALATRAGVLAGRMLALGTTDELKKQYADAYYVQLVHRHGAQTGQADMQRMTAWVRDAFPEARLDNWIAYGQVRFEIPLRWGGGGVRSLAEVFGVLEGAKATLGVEFYGVTTATLDQIFLEVVGRHQVEEAGGE